MDDWNKLILELKKVRLELISAIDKFPKEKREEILFDKWSLKDILSHLSGWDKFTIQKINEFLNGKIPRWEISIDKFNDLNVTKNKNKPWNEIYDEFVKLSLQNIKSYKIIPTTKHDSLIWKDKKYTPKKFLMIDIDHYKNEHLSKILKVLNS
jgi:hypothetical protein